MSLRKYDREVAIVLAIVIIILMVAGSVAVAEYSEPSIHNVTYDELTDVVGIGPIKANRILSYLETNKEAVIDDLDDINGIGDILIERLEKEFR